MKPIAEPGTSSKAVADAQKLLNQALKQSRVKEDGAFDKDFTEAIKEFQKECGIKADGVLDQRLLDLMKEAADGERPAYQVTLKGKTYLLTQRDLDALHRQMKADFAEPVEVLASAAAEARLLHKHMEDLNNDQYVVSWMIEVWSSKSLPSGSRVTAAEDAVKQAKRSLASGDFKNFGAQLLSAQKEVNAIRKEMHDYIDGMISGGESLATTLEVVSATCFVVVGVLAVPVAASYGLGAVAAGVVAGAGTGAVETLAHEVGKGINGQSGGIGDATLNVLRDAFIGGTVGAVVKGGVGKKLADSVGKQLVKRLGGAFAKEAGEDATLMFFKRYFQNNGADILEGIIKDAIKQYKSNAKGLTADILLGIIVKEVLTAGAFKNLDKAGAVQADAIFKRLSNAQKKQFLEGLGPKAKMSEVEEAVAKAFGEGYKEIAGEIYKGVVGKLTGDESTKQIEDKAADEMAKNRALLARIEAEIAKRAKKNKK
jgi:peptidoglycan hydrolase-like protein with peptidoglycan-binding domain